MEEIMTVEEVAAYLKVSKNTIRRWCVKGKLPAFKIEREWRIYREDLERVIRQSSYGQDKVQVPSPAIAGAGKENDTILAMIDM